jgi:hypothetical protein
MLLSSGRPSCAHRLTAGPHAPGPTRAFAVGRRSGGHFMRKEALLLVPALAAVVGILVVVSRSGAG